MVGVGENLRDQYQLGDRFIVQAEIYVKGVNYAYGYMLQGGLSEYGVIDQRILNGDDGNYLIPVQPATGYAESALTEPWACVTAAYGLQYRTGLKPGGTAWIIGDRDRVRGQESGSSLHDQRRLRRGVAPGAAAADAACPPTFAAWLRDARPSWASRCSTCRMSPRRRAMPSRRHRAAWRPTRT